MWTGERQSCDVIRWAECGSSPCSFRLVSVQVREEDPGDEEGDEEVRSDWDSLPWFGSSEPTGDITPAAPAESSEVCVTECGLSGPAGPLVPLRANRSVFLPLWNNVDHSGEVWREAPPTEQGEDEDDEEDEGRVIDVTVKV